MSSIEFEIPDGFGIPLVDLDTDLLPQPTMDALDALYAGGGGGGAVDSVNGQTGVVVLDADDIADGTTNHAFTAADDTKLAGIATAATANSSDATLLARANHTGTQLAATVSDFNTAADARVVAGITGKLDTSAAPELIRDTMGTALVAGTNVTITPNDGADTITVAASGGGMTGWPGIYGPPVGGYMRIPGIITAQEGAFPLASGDLWAIPLTIFSPVTLAKIGFGHWGNGSSGSVVRLGLYAANTSGYPSSLVLDAGTLPSHTGANQLLVATVSQALSVGGYFAVIVAQGAPSTAPNAIGTFEEAHMLLQVGQTADQQFTAWKATGVTGALPGTYPGSAAAQMESPVIYLGA